MTGHDRTDELKAQAASPEATQRALVAQAEDAPPELLYYLTGDADETVRQAAAENAATPVQAAPKQQMDESRLVRAALARKLGRALPGLVENRQAMEVLAALARDTAVEVREAVAVTLQDTAFLPPPLARELAGDSERSVAGPVLRFSLSLSDDDLVELVRGAKRDWVAVEVAQRKSLSNRVALAVWESGNTEAAGHLLGNAGAQTEPAVIDEAVEVSATEVQLQPPLVRHPGLTHTQMGRLAEFVNGSLLGVLAERAALDRGTLSDVSQIVRRRLDWAEWRKKGGTGAERARAMFQRKQLDGSAISDAVAWGERDFVVAALALLAGIAEGVAEKILSHQSPKGIMALCWKAGISMRVCRMVEIRVARVPVMKVPYARGGTDYPLPPEDMIRHLELYGIGE